MSEAGGCLRDVREVRLSLAKRSRHSDDGNLEASAIGWGRGWPVLAAGEGGGQYGGRNAPEPVLPRPKAIYAPFIEVITHNVVPGLGGSHGQAQLDSALADDQNLHDLVNPREITERVSHRIAEVTPLACSGTGVIGVWSDVVD